MLNEQKIEKRREINMIGEGLRERKVERCKTNY